MYDDVGVAWEQQREGEEEQPRRRRRRMHTRRH